MAIWGPTSYGWSGGEGLSFASHCMHSDQFVFMRRIMLSFVSVIKVLSKVCVGLCKRWMKQQGFLIALVHAWSLGIQNSSGLVRASISSCSAVV